nr:coat protein [Partitiviridae sp.]
MHRNTPRITGEEISRREVLFPDERRTWMDLRSHGTFTSTWVIGATKTMIEIKNEMERNAVYYPVDLRVISEISSDISNTADGLGQPWYKMRKEAIELIILSALKVNFVLNHKPLLLLANKTLPDQYLLNILQGALLVPRFIRDLIREILRPMHHSGITYLPDIDLTTRLTPHLLDMFHPISEHLTKWSNVCNKLGFEMVPILPEAVQSVSLTFYTYETDEILSFDNITTFDWRLESFGRTKHLVYNPSSSVGDLGKTNPTTSRKRAQDLEVNEIEVEKPIYERPIINRRILGMIVFRYTCAPYPSRLGYIPSNYRFPTEMDHSQTPPLSCRVHQSEQTMVRINNQYKKKPKNTKMVNVECAEDRSH